MEAAVPPSSYSTPGCHEISFHQVIPRACEQRVLRDLKEEKERKESESLRKTEREREMLLAYLMKCHQVGTQFLLYPVCEVCNSITPACLISSQLHLLVSLERHRVRRRGGGCQLGEP